jgi:excinuclease ABC subunit C
MDQSSSAQDYERAATYRDQIRALSQIQQQQEINIAQLRDVDIIALAQAGGQTCFQLFMFRNGRNCGTTPYFIKHESGQEPDQLMADFLMQLYENHSPAPQILLSHMPEESTLVAQALSQKFACRVTLNKPTRGIRRKLIDQALLNAQEALTRRLNERQSQGAFLAGLKSLFNLPTSPQRVEIYDNSHLFGTDAYGIMVVATENGFEKKEYRKFKLLTAPDTRGGDDYAMMREVMLRRFAAFSDQPEGKKPDLLLIDGGKGQLSTVCKVLEEMGVSDIPVVAISKGPDRNAGRETFFRQGHEPLSLDPTDPLLYFLQRLRDEAHRFAIGTHRAKRIRNLEISHLDQIPGVGAARKKTLLQHFGSSYNVRRAGLEDLSSVKGIDENLARRIYDYFHSTT